MYPGLFSKNSARLRVRPFPMLVVLLLLPANPCVEEADNNSGEPGMIHLSLVAKKSVDAPPSMTVTWCSGEKKGAQYVKYGLTPELGITRRAEKNNLTKKRILIATMKNLRPDSKYYYRCGSDVAGWSPLYSFVTEPSVNGKGSFRIGVFGDTQNNTNNEEFRKTHFISGLLETYSPAFCLHMGDIVDNGSVASTWLGFLSVTQELNAGAPLMPVLGNHDVDNNPGVNFQNPFADFHKLFTLPGDEVNYSFTYKNVRFIAIFSGCAEAAAKAGQVKYQPGSPEYRWLDEELTRAENESGIRWIVLYMHYPVYSFGWSNIAKWRDSLIPLIENHRVDLCLAGHRHVYERHFQINKGIPVPPDTRNTFPAGKGTVYITNGTAGGNPTGTGGKDLPDMAFTPDNKQYGFSIMDISDESITYRYFDQENILTDWFTIVKE